MSDVRLAHTAHLDAGDRAAVRGLLDAAFAGDFSDDDWEHALGGMHALVWEGGELVGHAAVVQRRLLHGGRALPRATSRASACVPTGEGVATGGR